MFANFLIWLVLLALALLFAWLVIRAWHSRRWYVRWPGVFLSGLFSLIFFAVCATGLLGYLKGFSTHGSPVQLTVEATPAQVERGRYLANVYCVSCHSQTGELPLSGGVDQGKDSPLPIGSFVSVNLTPGGPMKDWSDGEIFQVLRQGTDRQGRLLAVMPTVRSRYMSDEDLKAIIAFLRSQPAVDHPTQDPPDQPNFLGILLNGMGVIQALPEVSGAVTAPPRAATPEYGAYILSAQDCQSCHGDNLTGGTNPVTPKGPTLRMVKGWTQAQFIDTMRTGMDPNGHALNRLMPWKYIGRMDDTDLAALYLYIAGLK
jgi:mono/diheme cytochrome c family protein